MEEKILIKKNIIENLPYGGLSRIARAVKEKTGKEISVRQVKNVCDPTKTSWNADVIAEAQAIIIAEKKEVITAKENIV